MSADQAALTRAQERAAREAFETRLEGYRWWFEHHGEPHPALRKDENGDYVERPERHRWEGFKAGYRAALAATPPHASRRPSGVTKATRGRPRPEGLPQPHRRRLRGAQLHGRLPDVAPSRLTHPRKEEAVNAWYWILLIYPWTVIAAFLILQPPGERREIPTNALLWPILIPWALLSGPLNYLFSTLRWWPQQRRLISMTEGLLSAYPDRRLRQVESRLRHAGKLGRFLLRTYYHWLADERQRLMNPEGKSVIQ